MSVWMPCPSFVWSLQLAEAGNAQNIDLLVEDIYGGDYDEYVDPYRGPLCLLAILCRGCCAMPSVCVQTKLVLKNQHPVGRFLP